MSSKITIVIPVYGDWPSLKRCIESVVTHVDTKIHTVLLVNDCGPDAEMIEKNIKRLIQGKIGFKYYRNQKNLGFLQNCNNAVTSLDKTNNNILLLNSDTIVTEGFLDELMGVLSVSPRYGAVSPRSNNASITTVPLATAAQKGIGKERSWKIYQKIRSHLPRFYEAPVAHGFCMLIRRSLIKKYGLFDEVFGKGYGEEVDFCQRIATHGHKSLIANHAYVFHEEAKSFSMEIKNKLLEQNNKIIWERYPNYRQSVRDYMEEKLPFEADIERKSGVRNYLDTKSHIKQTIKRNKYARKVIQKIKSRKKSS